MEKNTVANADGMDLFGELRRLSPKVTGGLLRMRQEADRDGAVAAKYKLLTAMAISIAIRCGPCIRAYVRMAVDKGISQEALRLTPNDYRVHKPMGTFSPRTAGTRRPWRPTAARPNGLRMPCKQWALAWDEAWRLMREQRYAA